MEHEILGVKSWHGKSQWQNSHPDQNIRKLTQCITGQPQLPACRAISELILYTSVLIKHLTYAGRILINVKLIQPIVTFETMLTLSVTICAGCLIQRQTMHPFVIGIKLHNLMQTPLTDENPWHREDLE